ncbi:MAG: ABC transporter ATP-binding protein [Patescibacteria group bacterium]|nr:ABC transporter ATP-binding protein [Patescibacteria group bacterium]MDD5173096.1 ABC transporter ATP-binding protein [Patescibacteria group bacterium]
MIKIEKVEKIYGEEEIKTPALRGDSFIVEKGEFVAIMGPSGSGKSTLLHILGFLDRPTKGEYFFQGKSMNQYSDDELARIRNEKMGFIFQTFNLLPRTNVLDNVKLPLYYSRIKELLWEDKAKKALEMVGLSHRLKHERSQLSGGEKQRVAIARALVNDPDVIFADEPTGNLDSKSGQAVMDIIQNLNEKGHTIIMVTHEKYTSEMAKRIIKLKDGLIESDEKVINRHYAKDGLFK